MPFAPPPQPVPTPLSAPRVEVLDLPSAAGNVDLARAKTTRVTKLQARVLLPAGYDDAPARR